jgi:hypothetical protein
MLGCIRRGDHPNAKPTDKYLILLVVMGAWLGEIARGICDFISKRDVRDDPSYKYCCRLRPL